MKAQIVVHIGPMYSGKSEALLAEWRRATCGGYRVAMVTFKKDTRYDVSGRSVVSHAQNSQKADASVVTLAEARDVPAVRLADCVLIDEGQFFTDLEEGASALVSEGKKVVICALSSTWQRKPFGNVSALLAVADVITQHTAICKCGADAPFSFRISDETDTVVVGAADKYEARCRACFDDAE